VKKNKIFYDCSNSVKLENILWIENVVESTSAPLFFTNSKIDMASFVNPHKVVVKRNASSAFPSAQNGIELEGGVESERFKCQFSQMEGDWIYKGSLNWFPFQTNEHQGKNQLW
jgi:hypothetical protein